ncbi:hypothetical protein N6H14_21420 [Paenibacillus sp. CC-CFT747]|nr:hypothetical protein N6H14_21420 [Paenibacillus sp. CC-CFT747]
MNAPKRVLLMGDNERAPYHPMNRIEEELRGILEDEFALESRTDYNQLDEGMLKAYDLCLSYTDCWGKR